MKAEILRLDWISKAFDHTVILNYVNAVFYAKEIHALMGLNGVGKSTLLQIITGQTAPDSGRIWFQNTPVHFTDTFDANALGIYKLETVPEVVPQLDLAENIALRMHGKRQAFFNSAEAHRYAEKLLDEFALTDTLSPTLPGHQMTVLDRQIVNVLVAVANQARLLAIDEPFSVLDENESRAFKKVLLHAKACGITILLTSHSFQMVYDIADRISILRAGCCAATLTNSHNMQELLSLAMPIINGEKMSGQPERIESRSTFAGGEEVFCVEAQQIPRLLSPLHFRVCAGEILGIVNMGATRASVCESLFGLFGRCGGSFKVCGKPVVLSAPSAAIDAGIGCASDSDQYQNLVPQFTYTQNITLPFLHRLFPFHRILPALEHCMAEQYQRFLSLGEGRTLDSFASYLSAGMQKRLSLARWFSMPCRLLMLNEPFKNLDPQGCVELTKILQEKAKAGTAFILEFSSFNTLLDLCDRVLVVNNNHVLGMLEAPHISPQKILSMLVDRSQAGSGGNV